MLNYIPINRAFYIYHFSVYIIVFLFERKSGKNYKFSNILLKKKKKNYFKIDISLSKI